MHNNNSLLDLPMFPRSLFFSCTRFFSFVCRVPLSSEQPSAFFIVLLPPWLLCISFLRCADCLPACPLPASASRLQQHLVPALHLHDLTPLLVRERREAAARRDHQGSKGGPDGDAAGDPASGGLLRRREPRSGEEQQQVAQQEPIQQRG